MSATAPREPADNETERGEVEAPPPVGLAATPVSQTGAASTGATLAIGQLTLQCSRRPSRRRAPYDLRSVTSEKNQGLMTRASENEASLQAGIKEEAVASVGGATPASKEELVPQCLPRRAPYALRSATKKKTSLHRAPYALRSARQKENREGLMTQVAEAGVAYLANKFKFQTGKPTHQDLRDVASVVALFPKERMATFFHRLGMLNEGETFDEGFRRHFPNKNA